MKFSTSYSLSPSEAVCNQYGGDGWLNRKGWLHGDFLTVDKRTNSVTWYAHGGSSVVRKYSFNKPPLCAVFCSLLSSNIYTENDNIPYNIGVAILASGQELQIHYKTGEKFEILLPTIINTLFSSPYGLILQGIAGANSLSHFLALETPTKDAPEKTIYYCISSPFSPICQVLSPDSVLIGKSHILAINEGLICMHSKESNQIVIFSLEKVIPKENNSISTSSTSDSSFLSVSVDKTPLPPSLLNQSRNSKSSALSMSNRLNKSKYTPSPTSGGRASKTASPAFFPDSFSLPVNTSNLSGNSGNMPTAYNSEALQNYLGVKSNNKSGRDFDRTPSMDHIAGRMSMGSQPSIGIAGTPSMDRMDPVSPHTPSHFLNHSLDASLDHLTIDGIQNDLFTSIIEAEVQFHNLCHFQFLPDVDEERLVPDEKLKEGQSNQETMIKKMIRNSAAHHHFAVYFHEHLHHEEGVYFHFLDEDDSILFQFRLDFNLSLNSYKITLLHTIDLEELKVISRNLISFSLPCAELRELVYLSDQSNQKPMENELKFQNLPDTYSIPVILFLCQNEFSDRGFNIQIVGTNLFYWYGQSLIQNDYQKFQDVLNGNNMHGADNLLAFRSLMKRIVDGITDEPFETLQIKALSSFYPSFAAVTYNGETKFINVSLDDINDDMHELVSIQTAIRKALLSSFPLLSRPLLSLWMSIVYEGACDAEIYLPIIIGAFFGLEYDLLTKRYSAFQAILKSSYIHYSYLELSKLIRDSLSNDLRRQLESVLLHTLTYYSWHLLLQSTTDSVVCYKNLQKLLQQIFSWILENQSSKQISANTFTQVFFKLIYSHDSLPDERSATKVVIEYLKQQHELIEVMFLPMQEYLHDVCWNVYLLYHFLQQLSTLSLTVAANLSQSYDGQNISDVSMPINTFHIAAKDIVQVFLDSVYAVLRSAQHDVSKDHDNDLNEQHWAKILGILPASIRSLLQIAFKETALVVSDKWPKPLLQWIGRNDVCANNDGNQLPPIVLPRSTASAAKAASSKKNSASTSTQNGNTPVEPPSDGLVEVEAQSSLRFPDDDRVHEVCRILRSSANIYVKVEKTPEMSDADYRTKQQTRLMVLTRRALAAPVGRGMLTIGTVEPLMAETLPIPPLVVNGRAPPNNLTITFDPSGLSQDWMVWPEFHNGVAAALRIGLKPAARTQKSHQQGHHINRVTRNWILYNKTESLSASNNSNSSGSGENAHAGFLLGLGLFGHLDVLTINDLCDYLTHGHELTCIAVLLGVTTSKISSADRLISKTLCLHLPSLLPSQSWDITISPYIQCAALIGLGYLYCRSGNRLIIQFLLEELLRKPFSDTGNECREALAVSAAWALGMILLPTQLPSTQSQHMGSSSTFERKPVEEVTQDSTENIAAGVASTTADIPTNESTELLTSIQDLKIEDRLYLLITGGHRPANTSNLFPTQQHLIHHDPDAKSSKVLEGDILNTDITAPAATISLGLMYMGTHNHKILQRLAIPTTVVALDGIRPDLLLYKSVSTCLILWDQVHPTIEWIDDQLPTILSPSNTIAQKKKYVGPYGRARQTNHTLSMSQCFTLQVNIITGYCLGIGLVYAGTFHAEAKNTLLNKLQWLQSIRDNKHPMIKKNELILDKIQKTMIEMGVCSISLALACIMAGSGDVDCLRTFRELRWRADDVSFGTHQAFAMAIGMLFLGGGKYSLKRDPVAIASLLLSIFPRYPIRAADQQYHLQAWRHLYALAVEPRVVHTIDIDSQLPVSVDLELLLRTGERLVAKAPGLLPELQNITSIEIAKHMEYYPTSIHLHTSSNEIQQESNSNKIQATATATVNHFKRYHNVTQQILPPLYVKKLPAFKFLANEDQLSSSYQQFTHAKNTLFRFWDRSVEEKTLFRTELKEMMMDFGIRSTMIAALDKNQGKIEQDGNNTQENCNYQVNAALVLTFLSDYPIIRTLLLGICTK